MGARRRTKGDAHLAGRRGRARHDRRGRAHRGAHIGGATDAHRQHGRGAARRQGQHAWIIRVEQGQTIGRQGAEQGAFFMGDGVEGAEDIEMAFVDGGDQAHARTHNLRQKLDLAEFVRGQLQHRQPLPGLQTPQGNGKAEAAVEAAGIAEDRAVGGVRIAGRERCCDQLFGRCLAAGTGYSNHLQRTLATDGAGVGKKGLAGVWYAEARDRQRAGRRLLAQNAGRAALHRLLDEVVAVAGFGLDGDKERPRLARLRAQGARVEGELGEAGGERRAVQMAARRVEKGA